MTMGVSASMKLNELMNDHHDGIQILMTKEWIGSSKQSVILQLKYLKANKSYYVPKVGAISLEWAVIVSRSESGLSSVITD